MIEIAWQTVGGDKKEQRAGLVAGKSSANEVVQLEKRLDRVIAILRENLDQLMQEELLEFDRILERKLYDLDRQEIHEYTDGSDEGLSTRADSLCPWDKIITTAVNVDPAKAVMDAECEEMC